jgi:hypothetical protein
MLGLGWGKNRNAPNHVLRSQRWLQCRLPKSVNTIAEDMKLDLPVDRMASYAAFLNIPIEMLQDESAAAGSTAFTQAVITARAATDALNLPLFAAFSQEFCKHFYDNNQEGYTSSLFELMRGVYTLQVLLPPCPEIYTGCLLVHANQEHLLRALAFMIMERTEIQYELLIYRWGNNLHLSYYSLDMFILGHLLAVDPLRYFATSQRRPFTLHLTGVADTIAGPRTFGLVQAWAERLDQPADGDIWNQWRHACCDVGKCPRMLPGDAAYDQTLARVLAPEHGFSDFNPTGP